MAVCSQIHIKHINTLCGQNEELLNVKPGGTYSNHWALQCKQLLSMLQVVNFTLPVQTHTGSETNIHSSTELTAKCLIRTLLIF